MLQLGQYRKSEHRQIYAAKTGQMLSGIDLQIHHRDFDGRNNAPSNLEAMTAVNHAQSSPRTYGGVITTLHAV